MSRGPMHQPRQADPAATVVVARDGAGGIEVLLLQRVDAGAFSGMWVFPGGRVEACDTTAGDGELDAARRGACRETSEEAGIELHPDALVALSHWTPPEDAPRRFTTWFFLAAAPDGDVHIDGAEIRSARWLSPDAALGAHRAGEIQIAPPTWVTLWTLTAHPDVASALARARAQEPVRFVTRIVAMGAQRAALWEQDSAYHDGDLARPGPRHRLWLHPGGWVYETPAEAVGSSTAGSPRG